MKNKLLLLLGLMVLIFSSISLAAPLWDSQTVWTSESGSVPEWTENPDPGDFFITSKLSLKTNETSAAAAIYKDLRAEYISFKWGESTKGGGYSGFKYGVNGGADSLVFYLDTAAGIIYYYDSSSKTMSYTDYTIIKIKVNSSVAGKYDLFIGDIYNGTYAYSAENVALDRANILNGASSSGMNVTWVCFSNDNTSCEYGATPAASQSLNITEPLPENNTSYNTQSLNFNLTMNSSWNANCSLNINNSVNQTTSNFLAGNNAWIRFNVTFYSTTSGLFNYSINCTNGIDKINSSTRNFYVDNINPTITWNYPSTSNNSIINTATNSSFIPSIILGDALGIYSYYLNLTTSTGALINSTNKTGILLSSFTVNNASSITNYSGKIYATMKVCDGHTDNNINFNYAGKEGSKLNFDDIKIYMETLSDTDSLNYVRQKDRYSFQFISKTASNKKRFIVESPKYIDILNGKTNYKGHLVTGDKWIDFEGSFVDSVVITRLTDKSVLVEVTSKTSRTDWNFNSIGDLNCVTEIKEFFVLTPPVITYTPEVLITQSNTFYLNISYDSAFISTISASLYYDATNYTATGSQQGNYYIFSKTLTAPYLSSNTNKTFYWDYIINTDDYNYNKTNQTVYVPRLDNCSLYNNTFINFTHREEINQTDLNGSIKYIFDYSYNNFSDSFEGETAIAGSHSFCMFPIFANFTSDINLQYSVSGYETRDWVESDFAVDNVTDYFFLYSLTSSASTEITFHVIDGDDNDLENVFIEAYRFDLINNTYLLVESEYTDYTGNAILNLKTGTEYYKFKFYQDGVLQLETTKFKLFSTTYEYVLGEKRSTSLGEWYQIDDGVTTTLNYSNTSYIVYFDWTTSLSLVDQFCLSVTTINQTVYYNSCSTNLTGSWSYTITQFNTSYLATGYVTTDLRNTFNLKTLSIDTFTRYAILASRSKLFISLIVLLTLSLLGLIDKNVAIISCTLAIIVLNWFKMLPSIDAYILPLCIVVIIILILINRRQT